MYGSSSLLYIYSRNLYHHSTIESQNAAIHVTAQKECKVLINLRQYIYNIHMCGAGDISIEQTQIFSHSIIRDTSFPKSLKSKEDKNSCTKEVKVHTFYWLKSSLTRLNLRFHWYLCPKKACFHWKQSVGVVFIFFSKTRVLVSCGLKQAENEPKTNHVSEQRLSLAENLRIQKRAFLASFQTENTGFKNPSTDV